MRRIALLAYTILERRRHRPRLSHRQRTVNRHHAKIRAVGARAVATVGPML
ncbi:hypothetical protein [Micromonospora echinospora]|uniref:hypothetical protein n=1 Tax=Micromonospora echinospora TaxID=1877 RepID=UPI003F4D3452